MLYNEPYEVNKADEPTDVIWENWLFTNKEINWKYLYTEIAITVLLVISFMTIFFLKETLAKTKVS